MEVVMKKLIVLFVLVAGTFAASQVEYTVARPKPICKVSRLGIYDIGVVCTNGSDPAGHKVGDLLIISCGKK
jgi:hypothetical protein